MLWGSKITKKPPYVSHTDNISIKILVNLCNLPKDFFKGKQGQKVDLAIFDDIVFVQDTTSSRYGGLLDRKTASAIAATNRLSSIEMFAVLDSDSLLKVSICGHIDQADAVGQELSEHNIFLQQPDTFDSSMPYLNPQYLIRPGSNFMASWDAEEEIEKVNFSPEVKNKVSEVFDSAVGPAHFSEVSVSEKLTTELKP